MIILLFAALITTNFMVKADTTLAAPSVTAPANWQGSATPYPQMQPAIQDPAGAGVLAYADQSGDSVTIIYEKAQKNYSFDQLEQYANVVFSSINLAYMNEGNPMVDSNSNTGFDGFAEGMNTTMGDYIRVLVLTRGDYFITLEAIYSYDAMNDAFSIIGSLSVPSGSATPTTQPSATPAPQTTTTNPTAPSTSTLAPPAISTPSGWQLSDSKEYPTWPYSIYDPAGAGLVAYSDQSGDVVTVEYEKPQTSLTSSQLQSDADGIFSGANLASLDSSGTGTYAGVPAGYAEGFNSTTNQYVKAVVFTKGAYFITALSLYSSQESSSVDSIMNSVNAAGTGLNSGAASKSSFIGSTAFFAIIGAVIAIIVVVVLLLMMKKRKGASIPTQVVQSNLPPPPPPN